MKNHIWKLNRESIKTRTVLYNDEDREPEALVSLAIINVYTSFEYIKCSSFMGTDLKLT